MHLAAFCQDLPPLLSRHRVHDRTNDDVVLLAIAVAIARAVQVAVATDQNVEIMLGRVGGVGSGVEDARVVSDC